MILTLSRARLTSVAMNRCNSRSVLFIHIHIFPPRYSLYCECTRWWLSFPQEAQSYTPCRFLALFVKLFPTDKFTVVTVLVTAMKLIDRLRLRIESIHGQSTITNRLFSVVELVTNMDSSFVSQPFQPLNCHLYGTFPFELILC